MTNRAPDFEYVTVLDSTGAVVSSFGSGTQYNEGDTDAVITGTAMLMEGAADTLLPVQGTVADGLLVNLGTNNDVTVTGSVTANAGTNLNTSALALEATLGSVKTAVELIDNAISGTEMQVDVVGALPTGTNTIGSVKLTDGTDVADVLDLASSNPLTVAVVDGSGAQITSFGGGTEYTEDAAAAADPVGKATILVRTDTPATQVTTDGDNVAQRGTNYGAAYVQLVTSAGAYIDSVGGGTEYTEDAAAAANPVGTALNLVRDDARGGSLTTTDGDNVAARGTNAGELYVKHVDSVAVTNAGLTELAAAINGSSQMDVNIAASAATLTVASHAVTNAGTFATQVDGAALTALQLIDDGVYTDDTSTHATGTSKGYGIMAVATPTDAAVDANDIGMVAMTTSRLLKVDASGVAVPVTDNSASLSVDWNGTQPVTGSGTATGALRVELPTNGTGVVGLAAGSASIGSITQITTNVTPGTGGPNLGKAEDGGHTSGDTGVFVLGVRNDTPNAALAGTDLDYSALATNKLGSLRVAFSEDDLATAATKHVKKYYTNAGAVTDGIVWSPGAGARWFVQTLVVNVSAAATVTFEDDLTAGDAAVAKFELAANSGVVIPFNPPLFSGEDAADLLITTSAGNVYVTVTGYEI